MSPSTRETAGNRTVLVLAAFLLIAGLVAALVGLQSGIANNNNFRKESTGPISCVRTKAHPGPLLDLGVQPSRGPAQRPLSDTQIKSLVRLAKQAGAKVISSTANWRELQPSRNGPYHWVLLDEVIAAARAAHLQVRLDMMGMPSWAVDTHRAPTGRWRPPLTTAELVRWTGFARALARHVTGKVSFLEVWTEPDETKTWPTGPDATAFARLLHATYAPVKAIAPRIQVVSGGLSGNDLGYLQQLYTARDTLYGAHTRLFDMVGVHPYSGDRSPTVDQAQYDTNRASFGDYDENYLGFRRIHAEMAAHGDGSGELYLSEFGYGVSAPGSTGPGLSDAQRAQYAGAALTAATCYPYVKALSWYYLFPTPWDSAAWTLLNSSMVPNQTYQALVAWSRGVAPLR